MSKKELMGPKKRIKRPSVRPDHSRGLAQTSASTESHGRTRHKMSYRRFSSKICRDVMGKNGKNTLAITMEKMFPKLEDAVILMYFDTLAKAFRPSLMPSSSTFRSFFNSTTSALSFTASTAVSTDMPTSDSTIAGRSFMPSPKKPTVCPFSRRVCTIRTFCFGESSANSAVRSAFNGSSSSVSFSSSLPVSVCAVSMPSLRQTETATSRLSPVSTRTPTCSCCSCFMAAAALCLGASKNARYPSRMSPCSSSGDMLACFIGL